VTFQHIRQIPSAKRLSAVLIRQLKPSGTIEPVRLWHVLWEKNCISMAGNLKVGRELPFQVRSFDVQFTSGDLRESGMFQRDTGQGLIS
jgi:hypothetical protein